MTIIPLTVNDACRDCCGRFHLTGSRSNHQFSIDRPADWLARSSAICRCEAAIYELSNELDPLGIMITIMESGSFQINFFTTSCRIGATAIADDDGAAATTVGALAGRILGCSAIRCTARAIVAPKVPLLRFLLDEPVSPTVIAKLSSHFTEIKRWLGARRSDAAGRFRR